MADVDISTNAAVMKHVDVITYNPSTAVKINVLDTQHIIQRAKNPGVGRVLLTSSGRVFDPDKTMRTNMLLVGRPVCR